MRYIYKAFNIFFPSFHRRKKYIKAWENLAEVSASLSNCYNFNKSSSVIMKQPFSLLPRWMCGYKQKTRSTYRKEIGNNFPIFCAILFHKFF